MFVLYLWYSIDKEDFKLYYLKNEKFACPKKQFLGQTFMHFFSPPLFFQCKGNLVPHSNPSSIACCSDGDLCNTKLLPKYQHLEVRSTVFQPTQKQNASNRFLSFQYDGDLSDSEGGSSSSSLDHHAAIVGMLSFVVGFGECQCIFLN